MSILFSRQCEYAIKAVVYLAVKKDGERVATNELTRRLNIPYHFVAKILQNLTKKGLLRSTKGPRGGFSLALPADEISFSIVDAIDAPRSHIPASSVFRNVKNPWVHNRAAA